MKDKELFKTFYNTFKRPGKLSYFDIFSRLDTRMEGWVEGELIKTLYKMRKKYEIKSTKCKVGGINPDIVIENVKNKSITKIEIKAICIGKRKFKAYLYKNRSLMKDLKKLVDGEIHYILSVTYPADKINEKCMTKNSRSIFISKQIKNVFPKTKIKETKVEEIKTSKNNVVRFSLFERK